MEASLKIIPARAGIQGTMIESLKSADGPSYFFCRGHREKKKREYMELFVLLVHLCALRALCG
ncbi:MAG: hypothetical protein C4532_00890 [Candidatus Abyssobacteria bacterium SURF_17]|uniref:Uncharacterized protein n=1 Tax=Candidatus Abyssobacteria bacterium SURF_17 TaxID=2093361 RepID=A0A419F933_9BACT|nr:MAG: hypothetical protein C4532_00890 [Candidatus Abyssubacteria bacterium SURF_17]